MYAVVIHDGGLLWQERPDPEPGDHDIVVRVRGAGVNGADVMQRAGRYPAPPGWPQEIPGLEMAGEVAAVGARVTRFAAGDRVMALVGGGAQAELAAVDEAHALAVPDGLSWSEAGGFMEAYATAYDALFGQAGVTLGDRVLVSGAAGGVGTAAVQLAAAAGATVTASVRSAGQRDAVAALGAARLVAPEDVEAAGPYDVVLELVGAASLPSALAALALRGRVVVIGVGSGSKVELDLLHLMGRRARLSASTLRARPSGEKAVLIATLGEKVVPELAAGRLKVPVLATFPLEEATAAYERFAAGGKAGKIVLTR
jgi:putative PIG3 family NAD(P)H quinone oxidoreductase